MYVEEIFEIITFKNESGKTLNGTMISILCSTNLNKRAKTTQQINKSLFNNGAGKIEYPIAKKQEQKFKVDPKA